MKIPETANEYDQGWNDAANGFSVTNVCSSNYLKGYLAYSEKNEDDVSLDPHLTDGVTVFLL